jgi:hypothetical protein
MTALTEEEARTKWCLQTMAGGRGWEKCLTSNCMAWRWKARFGPATDNPENVTVLSPTHGYCGLAEAPQ